MTQRENEKDIQNHNSQQNIYELWQEERKENLNKRRLTGLTPSLF